MTTPSFPQYRQRLTLSVPGALTAFVLAFLALGVIAFAYGVGQFHNPSVKLRLLLPPLTGMLMGWICGYILFLVAHARPREARIVLSLPVLFVAFVVAWIAWLHAATGWESALLNPLEYPFLLKQANQAGTWTMRGSSPIKGSALSALWLAEFAGIMLFGIMGAALAASDATPYCESCRTWAKPIGTTEIWGIPPGISEFQKQLRSGNLSALSTLPEFNPEKNEGIAICVFQCPRCTRFTTLNLVRQNIVPDADGKTHTHVTEKIAHLIVTPESLNGRCEVYTPASPPPANS
jgi:hypothetical protein